MLSFNANFNSFYSVSKGIRHETLLKLSRIKSLLPVNLPRVNKTYFTTDSNNVFDIFSNQFNLQKKKEIEQKRRILYQASMCRNIDINSALIVFNDFCFNVSGISELFDLYDFDTYSDIAKEYQNFIFYFFVMNEEFFIRASVKLCNLERYSSENFISETTYEDTTITHVNYIGFYVIATNEELKEKDYQKIKISI
jgi:hypothetical protein